MSLGIRATGRPEGVRLHLRPIDAAWGEAFECDVPCTALVGPGSWAVGLAPARGIAPLRVDGSPLALMTSGRLDVGYRSNAGPRTAGVVLLIVGAIALVGGVVGVLSSIPDPRAMFASVDQGLGLGLFSIVGVAGIALGVTGIVLSFMGPSASARWTPDP